MADLTERERVLAARRRRLVRLIDDNSRGAARALKCDAYEVAAQREEKRRRAVRRLAHVAAQLRALKASARMSSLGGGVA